MKTLTVNINDNMAEKAITAVLDALKLEYEIEDDTQFNDETERVMANTYLADKLRDSQKDMAADKGTTIALDDLWK
jgi:hypothetical protein